MDIWRKLSALLANTSEEEHLEVDIPISTSEDVGLSDLEKPHVKEIWQDVKEGIITFKVYGDTDEYDLSDYPEYQPSIVKYLEDIMPPVIVLD